MAQWVSAGVSMAVAIALPLVLAIYARSKKP